jgi:CheY-like chemotaxis protein/tetratricopeptide (TPR) repeat protein
MINRILYIDDDLGMRSCAASALREHGFEVTAAGGNDKALAILQQDARQFCIVVQDSCRPLGKCLSEWGEAVKVIDVSGVEFLKKHVWRLNPSLPCLFVTGDFHREGFLDGVGLGQEPFAQWLPKPVAVNELVATIRELIAMVRGTMRTADWMPLPWEKGPSNIVRYDQKVMPGNEVGDEWLDEPMSLYEPDERCCQMVLAGDIRLGEIAEVTVPFLCKVLQHDVDLLTGKTIKPERNRDVFERMRRRLAPDGRDRVGTRLFQRIRSAADEEFGRILGDRCLEHINDEEPLDRGCCWCCRKEWAKAVKDLGVALSKPTDVRAYLCRGRARHMLREVQEANEDFGRYLASDTAFRRPTAFAWYALSLADGGNPEGALRQLEQAIRALEVLPAVRPAWANVISSSGIECWLGGGGCPEWIEPDMENEEVQEIEAVAKTYGGRLLRTNPIPPEPKFHWFACDLSEVIAAARELGCHAGLAASHRVQRKHLENRLLDFRRRIRM